MTASYGYDVFGELRSGGPGATDRLFTGEQRDADSGLYYLRARYYDPSIGRFLSQDPLPGGNLYAYVGNNPVTYVDPYGLIKIKIGGKTVFDTKPVEQVVNETEEFVTETVPEAAEWTTNQVAAAGEWAYQNTVAPVVDYLATCDWGAIAVGTIGLLGVGAAVGTGGYLIVAGYGGAAGATTVVGAYEGFDVLGKGILIATIGSGTSGGLAWIGFSRADCGQRESASQARSRPHKE